MLWELLIWAQPKAIEIKNLSLNLNLMVTSLIAILYLFTSKKTRILGASFFICEAVAMLKGFGLYKYEWHIYIGYLLIFCYFAKIQLEALKDRFSKFVKVSFCSLALIILFAYASYDAYTYPKIKTAFYLAYPNILLCIHVCLIVSFYDARRILNSLGDKFSSLIRLLRSNYTIEYFCYTISYRFKPRF